MKDEEFEKTMDAWASHEVKSAPELRPTEEIHRMVKAQKRKIMFPTYARRVLVRVAAACLVLACLVPLVMLYPTIFGPSDSLHKPFIRQRKGAIPEKGITIENLPGRRGGGKKGLISFNQLVFYYQKYQKRGPEAIRAVDIRFPQKEGIALTSNDNYGLLLQTAADRYVYVYQLDSRGIMVKLFPGDVYGSLQNPLRKGQEYYLPPKGNWLYLGKEEGEERIYVIASAQPMQKLEDLYVQYDKADNRQERQEVLSRLLKEFDAVGETAGEEAVRWVFEFDHR